MKQQDRGISLYYRKRNFTMREEFAVMSNDTCFEDEYYRDYEDMDYGDYDFCDNRPYGSSEYTLSELMSSAKFIFDSYLPLSDTRLFILYTDEGCDLLISVNDSEVDGNHFEYILRDRGDGGIVVLEKSRVKVGASLEYIQSIISKDILLSNTLVDIIEKANVKFCGC